MTQALYAHRNNKTIKKGDILEGKCPSPGSNVKQTQPIVARAIIISNIQEIIWAGNVDQVVECLPKKCKALSSNHSTTRGKKEKEREEITKL
jgi:hypothetical protein